MKTHIVIHHSLTKDSQTVSWGAIRRFHMIQNGWTDIGYHFGCELVGDYYEIMMGRPIWSVGAHCKELRMNSVGIGLCVVGNFDEIPPPDPQLEKTAQFVRHLMTEYGIPRHNIIGHREAGLAAGYDWTLGQYKSCPGSKFNMDVFRAML